jgi:hypothetical protein
MSGEQKDVTAIRGLDSDLYNKMHAKAKEIGKNVSDLMNDAMKLYLDQVLGAPTIYYGTGAVNLKVSKNDLARLGKVSFKGVKNLRFSEDVDEEAIENHIVSIESCVDVKVPEPIYVSVMKKARGCVNVQSYPVGANNTQGRDTIRIGGLESLEVSNGDLKSLGRKVVLEDIDKLKLGPDVDAETVNQCIEVIKDVKELAVPSSIFMLILTKVRDCGEVTKY